MSDISVPQQLPGTVLSLSNHKGEYQGESLVCLGQIQSASNKEAGPISWSYSATLRHLFNFLQPTGTSTHGHDRLWENHSPFVLAGLSHLIETLVFFSMWQLYNKAFLLRADLRNKVIL